jgi:hypothetical protein
LRRRKGRDVELRRGSVGHAGGQRLLLGAVTPLRDPILLNAIDRQPVPPARLGEAPDVGDMLRRMGRRQPDHDALAARELHDQQLVVRDRSPVCLDRIGGERGGRRGLRGGKAEEKGEHERSVRQPALGRNRLAARAASG